MAALRTEARFVWPNTDAGRADLLTYVNAEMDRVRARMPEVFARVPTSEFLVNRVPPAIEAGAPGGYAQGGSLDGTRPGIYFINLKDKGVMFEHYDKMDGLTLNGDVYEGEGMKTAWFKDPDGNILSLIEA